MCYCLEAITRFKTMTSAATPLIKTATAAKRILMCRPTYFELTYSINPWMDMKRGVNKKVAMEQWNKLKSTLEQSGAVVEVMEPDGAEGLPDMVFSANAAVIRGQTAYLASFAHKERQGERFFFEQWFSSHGYRCVGDKVVHFEGAGDALWGGRNMDSLFVGVGPRTDPKAVSLIQSELHDEERPWKAVTCRLVDPRFYHIDTAFCPLNEEVAIFNPHAFDHPSLETMRQHTDLIPVSPQEACNFACNAVVVGQSVIMHKENDGIASQLERLGFTVRFVDMSEFIKSGGSSKCCTLAI